MENKYIIIIVLIFILILLWVYNNQNNNKQENFTNKYVVNDNIYLGHRRDPWDLLDDSLFANVITFNNDDDLYQCGSRLGIEKCIQECPGKCIEFGITGIGQCFAPDATEARGKDRWKTVGRP